MIVAEWWLPKKFLECQPCLRIDILFHNFTQTCVEFPICTRIGYETFSLLNKEFKETGGLLAYRAQIVTCDGEVFKEWKHQLWVKLISTDEEIDEMSSAVIEKSKQGSVIETPDCKSPN